MLKEKITQSEVVLQESDFLWLFKGWLQQLLKSDMTITHKNAEVFLEEVSH